MTISMTIRNMQQLDLLELINELLSFNPLPKLTMPHSQQVTDMIVSFKHKGSAIGAYSYTRDVRT